MANEKRNNLFLFFEIIYVIILVVSTIILGYFSSPLQNSELKQFLSEKYDIPIEKAPYNVSILEKNGGCICSGSLISPGVVLTAAHCTEGYKPSELEIRTGSSRYDGGGDVTRVKKILQHEKYNNKHDYDISLLELEKSLTPSDTIQVVKLADTNDELKVGTFGMASGFGIDENIYGLEPILRAGDYAVVSQDHCKMSFPGVITDRMICAGAQSGFCHGDSGGPFVVDGLQHGVVSAGASNVMKIKPGVYSRVNHPEIRKWIKEKSGV